MNKLREMSPGLRRFLGGFQMVLSILAFIAGPILILVGIILAVKSHSGLPAAIYIPSGIGSFISGFFIFASGDMYANYDNQMAKLNSLYTEKRQAEYKKINAEEKPLHAVVETKEPQPDVANEKLPEKETETPESLGITKEKFEFQKAFERCLDHDEKGKAIDLINDALSKNVITEAEYQEYYSTIK
jgi:hypothetical protein